MGKSLGTWPGRNSPLPFDDAPGVMRTVVAVVLGALALAGCTGGNTSSTTSSATAASTSSSSAAPAAVTAQQVVDAFGAAGLSVPKPRDNSKNCSTLGCEQQITTDAITVLSFKDETAAVKYAETGKDNAHRNGLVVLSYAAARTPEADRPKYQAELAKLLG